MNDAAAEGENGAGKDAVVRQIDGCDLPGLFGESHECGALTDFAWAVLPAKFDDEAFVHEVLNQRRHRHPRETGGSCQFRAGFRAGLEEMLKDNSPVVGTSFRWMCSAHTTQMLCSHVS